MHAQHVHVHVSTLVRVGSPFLFFPFTAAGGREEMGRGKEGTGRKKEGLDNQSEPRGGEMRGCALRVACDGLPAHHLAFSVALLA